MHDAGRKELKMKVEGVVEGEVAVEDVFLSSWNQVGLQTHRPRYPLQLPTTLLHGALPQMRYSVLASNSLDSTTAELIG
jgi:hypothetical protein